MVASRSPLRTQSSTGLSAMQKKFRRFRGFVFASEDKVKIAMGYVVAIPSHRRADVFEKKAYRMLTTEVRRRTFVFVQNPEDYAAYSERFPDVSIVPTKNASGRWSQGYAHTLHFIRKYFPLGKKICFLHDDVQGVVRSVPRKNAPPPACFEENVNFKLFMEKVFGKMQKKGIHLAGVYPSRRGDNCQREPETTGLKFIYDPLHFEINSRLPPCQFVSKCDYEMTAESFLRHGAVLRFNRYSAKTRHDPLRVKSSHDRDASILRHDAEGLLRTYPQLFKGMRYFPGTRDYSMIFAKQ